jgi:hypothetical protein
MVVCVNKVEEVVGMLYQKCEGRGLEESCQKLTHGRSVSETTNTGQCIPVGGTCRGVVNKWIEVLGSDINEHARWLWCIPLRAKPRRFGFENDSRAVVLDC